MAMSARPKAKAAPPPGTAARLVPPVCVVVVIHGGDDAKTDVLQACRNGWNVLVLEGAGGFADTLAARFEQLKTGAERNAGADGALRRDVVLDEILRTAKISVLNVQRNSVPDLTALLVKLLTPPLQGAADPEASPSDGAIASNDTIARTWRMCATYTTTAASLKLRYMLLEAALMALSLMTVLLIAIDSDIRFNANHWSEQRRERYVASFWHWILTFLTGIAPILNGVVLSIKNRFNFFAKHAAFVEASALLSKELYLFRTCTLHYADARFRRSVLADRLRRIDADLTAGGGKEVAMVGPAKRPASTTGSRTRPRAPRCSSSTPRTTRCATSSRTSTSSSAPSGRRASSRRRSARRRAGCARSRLRYTF